jgi:hypothetical protein
MRRHSLSNSIDDFAFAPLLTPNAFPLAPAFCVRRTLVGAFPLVVTVDTHPFLVLLRLSMSSRLNMGKAGMKICT